MQEKAFELQRTNFTKTNNELTSEAMFIHLVEEVGEIARQVFNRKVKLREVDNDNLKEEITQSILDLLVIAELEGIDIEKESLVKIEEMKNR